MNMIEDNKQHYNDIPQNYPRRRVKRVNDNFFGQFIVCLICVVLLAVIVYKDEIASGVKHLFNRDQSASKKWELSLPFISRRQNILLMGVDVSDNKDRPFENTRSDSIYLISIAPHVKDVNVISIPRDSKVYIHSRSNPDKINHAFAYGGVDLSVKTIEETLGVRINHYVVVSNTALVEFIDKIGGVDVYVEKPMHYRDNTAKLYIDLEKGIQHLDGGQAEGYLRYRKDGLGDIGRIRRQQWFLNALATRLKDPSAIIKIPEAIKAASKYIQTDFSFYELAQYATLIKTIDLSKVQVATLPGEPSQRGFTSYWILDPKGVQEIVDKFVYGEKTKILDRPLEGGILYTSENLQAAQNLQRKLEEKGVNVNMREVKQLGHDHIAIHNFEVPNEAIVDLKNTVLELKNKQTVFDIIGINKAAKDFTVVLEGS